MVDKKLDVVKLAKSISKITTLPLGRLDEQKIDAAPVVRRVVDLFGAGRVMWGSDIAQSKGSYGYMVDLGLNAVRLLSEDEQHQVLYGAADAVYGSRLRA